MVDAPQLASHCGVGRVLVKNEAERALGNFKSLGGLRAGLGALARVAGAASIEALLAQPPLHLPPLIAASAGNHGLAVAAAARLAGTKARIFVHSEVSADRVQRIMALGADLIRVNVTYDDAVERAAQAAAKGEGLLIADTSRNPNDPVVKDVILGYQRMAAEIVEELTRRGDLTHVFVQAGVGGLAAAMAAGLCHHVAHAPWLVIVEPVTAACVAAALEAGRPVRLDPPFSSNARMLACGEASAPALELLRTISRLRYPSPTMVSPTPLK